MKVIFTLMSLSLVSTAIYATEDSVNCRAVKACTREYRPTECVYKNDLRAQGSNRCMAIGKIEQSLCAESGLDRVRLDKNQLKCI